MRAYLERGRWRCRPQIRPGVDGRLNLELNLGDIPEAEREAAAQARASLIGELLRLLKASGHDADLRERAARNLAEAEPAGVATHEAVLRKASGGVFARPEGEMVTVQAFGERWTSGQLATEFPDQVRLRKSRTKDRGRLERWLYPLVGHLPLAAVGTHHFEEIAKNLIRKGLRASSRGSVLRLIKRLFDLAYYPAKLIPKNAFPESNFLPKETPRTLPFLRPSEDLTLMRCTRIRLKYRIFYGLLNRVGFRRSELRSLCWSAVDFEAGVLRFEDHKTVGHMGEKEVPLGPAEIRALAWWRRQNPTDERVFRSLLFNKLLRHLKMAGIRRDELFVTNDVRRRLSLHHLRGGFVTIACAQGRSTTWIMDRTGHLSLSSLARYLRAGRLAERMGDWAPLHEAIPEIAADSENESICPQGGQKAQGKAKNPNPTYNRPPVSGVIHPAFFPVNPMEGGPSNDVCGQPADRPELEICPQTFSGCSDHRRAA